MANYVGLFLRWEEYNTIKQHKKRLYIGLVKYAKFNHHNLFSDLSKGETALHMASQLGLLELVKVLLSNGANPNTQTLYIEPPPKPKPVKTITKLQSRPPSEKLLLPPANQQPVKHRDSNGVMRGDKKSNTPLTNDQLLSGGMLDYNPFSLDEADNPFTEENDPSNPFADNTEEDEDVECYNPFSEQRDQRTSSMRSSGWSSFVVT